MASRKLTDLSPCMQEKAKRFLQLCQVSSIDYLIYCTYRSGEEQDYLYRVGRDLPGKIVTYARAGQSKHNVVWGDKGNPSSEAWDGVPLGHGKPLWSLYAMDTTNRRMIHPIWEKVLEIGRGIDLISGYDWKKFKEACHWEKNG